MLTNDAEGSTKKTNAPHSALISGSTSSGPKTKEEFRSEHCNDDNLHVKKCGFSFFGKLVNCWEDAQGKTSKYEHKSKKVNKSILE